MYKTLFGLNSNPFDVVPHLEFLVFNEHTLDALNCLLYGVQNHRGFVQLTGEVGTGMLLNTLMNKLSGEPFYQSAFIFNSRPVEAAAKELELEQEPAPLSAVPPEQEVEGTHSYDVDKNTRRAAR
jgi:hypothetical protein